MKSGADLSAEGVDIKYLDRLIGAAVGFFFGVLFTVLFYEVPKMF